MAIKLGFVVTIYAPLQIFRCLQVLIGMSYGIRKSLHYGYKCTRDSNCLRILFYVYRDDQQNM